METIVFYQNNMVIGGAETLILRLLKWYALHSYRVVLLTLNKIEDVILSNEFLLIDQIEHYIYDISSEEFYSSSGKLLTFDNESVCVYTDRILYFFDCFYLLSKRRYNSSFVYRIYIVHPTLSLISKYFVWANRGWMRSLIERKILLFMDEETRDACVEYYGLNLPLDKFEILRLPIRLYNDVMSSSKNQSFNILSMCRFDFPFKGYVFGLIDAFVDLFSIYDISLTLIGYGPGEKQLREKIESLPIEIQCRINMCGKVPYSEVNTYIDKCDIFVGMGTTVLDAANRNKICIVPVSYQMVDFACGFFHDDYRIIQKTYKEACIDSYQRISVLIQSVLDFNNDNYRSKEELSKQLLNENYNIDFIAPKIADVVNVPSLSFKDIILIHFWRLMRRKLDSFKIILNK